MKALLVKIDFFEAFFKVHYTKTTRLTYPAPLPTSIAGMFGAMLGWERKEKGPPKDANRFLFGGKILSLKGTIIEQATYIQVPKNIKGAAPLSILNEPSYLIAMGGEEPDIDKYQKQLLGRYVYLPHGGQNDFFVKDIGVIGKENVKVSKEIESYAPKDLVERVQLEKGTSLYTLPVMHRYENMDNIFYFIGGGGKLILKNEKPCVRGICLYPLSDFYWVSG